MPKLKKNKPSLFTGTQLTTLLLGDEINGEFPVMKSTIVKGLEPPMHRFCSKRNAVHLYFKHRHGDRYFTATSTDYEAIAAEFPHPASNEAELPDAIPPADQTSKVIAFSANYGLTFQTHE